MFLFRSLVNKKLEMYFFSSPLNDFSAPCLQLHFKPLFTTHMNINRSREVDHLQTPGLTMDSLSGSLAIINVCLVQLTVQVYPISLCM